MAHRRSLAAFTLTLGMASVVAAACSSFSTSAPEIDASTEVEIILPDEASVALDAREPTADANAIGENLADNPGFANACAQWLPGAPNAGSAAEAMPGRDGGVACLVCGKKPDGGAFDLWQEIRGVVPTRGATFVGEAYVRAPLVASTAVATNIEAAFIVYDLDRKQRRQPGNRAVLGTAWTRVVVEDTVASDAGVSLEFSISSSGDGEGCFVVDDARVYTQ